MAWERCNQDSLWRELEVSSINEILVNCYFFSSPGVGTIWKYGLQNGLRVVRYFKPSICLSNSPLHGGWGITKRANGRNEGVNMSVFLMCRDKLLSYCIPGGPGLLVISARCPVIEKYVHMF